MRYDYIRDLVLINSQDFQNDSALSYCLKHLNKQDS